MIRCVFSTIKKFNPQDATTNPSLILKASTLPEYQSLIDDAIDYAKKRKDLKDEEDRLPLILDRLAVNFGSEISKIVPGYISTEVDARLSFVKSEYNIITKGLYCLGYEKNCRASQKNN